MIFEEKYIKFYKTFDKRFKNNDKLILCSKTLSHCGVEQNSKLNSKHFNGETNVGI